MAKQMPEPNLHVLFSPSAAVTLKEALLMADRPDEILCSFDNFSFGPIATDDAGARAEWVEETLGRTGFKEVTDKSATFLARFEAPTAPLTLWLSRRETTTYAGFLWWLSHMGDIPVSIIEAEELIIENAEGMVKLLDHAVPLSIESRSLYQMRWEQLKIENAPLRVIDGEDLVSAQIDHFDGSLLSHVTFEWQKMSRIVGFTMVDFFDAGVYQTGDLVLGARLANLAETGKLEWRGDLSHMQRCEVRLPAG